MSNETVQTAAKWQVGRRVGARVRRGSSYRSLRRLALLSAVLLALVPATLLAQSTVPATGPADEFASGGLGLTRAQWEARVGPGEAGQGAELYRVNGLTLAVLFDTGRIFSINWFLPGQEGVPLPAVHAEAARYLPADATLIENFDAPGAGIHPLLLVQLYQSPSLAGRFTSPIAQSGTFVVVYFLSSSLAAPEQVMQVDIYVGTQPPSLHLR